MFDRRFWTMTFERAVKSFAQTFVAILGVQTTLEKAPWYTALSTAAVAFVLSVMTSLGSLGVGPAHDPSLVPHESSGPGDPPAEVDTQPVAVA